MICRRPKKYCCRSGHTCATSILPSTSRIWPTAICLALGWSGDVGQARSRAADAGKGVKIKYNIPREGAIMFFDMLAIPADAPHPKNAHLFINYLLRPKSRPGIRARCIYATSNAAAYSLVDPAVFNDREVYPNDAQKAHMYPNVPTVWPIRASSTAPGRVSRPVADASGMAVRHPCPRATCSWRTSASASAISWRSTTSR
jgi:hypothetical protein